MSDSNRNRGSKPKPETTTVRMTVRAYDELMAVRQLMSQDGGASVLPPEYGAIAREELEDNREAFSRQAMQSIAARVLLAVAQKYRRSLLREDPVEDVVAEIVTTKTKGAKK